MTLADIGRACLAFFRAALQRGRPIALAVGLALAAAAAPAIAQSWWPFGGDDEPRRPPVPREPVYRPEPPLAPPPAAQPPAAANWTTKNPVCLQLEQRLVQEGQKGSQTRDLLPRIEAEIRQVDQTYNLGASKLDRNCYESFLFTRTFRSTPQCKDLAREVENAKRRLAELEAQRQDIVSTGGRSYQDDIIRELARNNCGANYADQARRRDSDIWQDEGGASANIWSPGGAAGAATYRTLCVRLCDGYYFPVSFSTLPSHFPQDAEICSSKCAAPSELYYYPNPGGSVDQSVALASQTPYTNLKSAFRYRKEFVQGCSCKDGEYDSASQSEKKADASGAGGQRATPAAETVTSETLPPTEGAAAAEGASAGGPAESPAAAPIEQGWQPQ